MTSFNTTDLDFNRRGVLSKLQIKRLGLARFLTVLAPYVVTLIIWEPIAMISSPLKGIVNQTTYLALMWISGLTLGGLATSEALFAWKLINSEIRQGNIKTLSGEVKLIIYEIRRKTISYRYDIQIGLQTFAVTKEVLLSMKNGEDYTAYYLPNLMALLSAEQTDSIVLSKIKRGEKVTIGDDGEITI